MGAVNTPFRNEVSWEFAWTLEKSYNYLFPTKYNFSEILKSKKSQI